MKKLTLHTETFIDSAHQLRGYDGACQRVHGHTWHVEVWIKGTKDYLDKVGILYDFGNIKKIHNKLDHRFINEIPPFDKINATAENLTMFMYDELKKENSNLEFKVRVYETDLGKRTYCEYGDWE